MPPVQSQIKKKSTLMQRTHQKVIKTKHKNHTFVLLFVKVCIGLLLFETLLLPNDRKWRKR